MKEKGRGGRWEWGAGAMEPGREALAKTPPCLMGGPVTPSRAAPGQHLPKAGSCPPPTPTPPRLAVLPAETLLPPPNPLPAPPGKGGRTRHPAWRWAGGPWVARRRPFPSLRRRARGEPVRTECPGRGRPLRPGPRRTEPSFSLPEGMAPLFSPKRGENPRERGGRLTSSSLQGQGNQKTSPSAPQKARTTYLKK